MILLESMDLSLIIHMSVPQLYCKLRERAVLFNAVSQGHDTILVLRKYFLNGRMNLA